MVTSGFFPTTDGESIANPSDRMIIARLRIDADRTTQQTSPIHLDSTDTTIVAYYRISRTGTSGSYQAAVFMPYASREAFRGAYGFDAPGFDEDWSTSVLYPGTTQAVQTTNRPFYTETGLTLQLGSVPTSVNLKGETVQPQNCWNAFDLSTVSSSAFANDGRYCPHFLFGEPLEGVDYDHCVILSQTRGEQHGGDPHQGAHPVRAADDGAQHHRHP